MPWAIFPTISVCGMYVSLILQSGFLAFQAATSMSTMSLLPPDRSHMLSSPLLAQEVAAAAGAAAAGAAPEGGDSDFFSHAATVATATRTDTGQLSWNLMPCSSTSFGISGRRNVVERASDCIVRVRPGGATSAAAWKHGLGAAGHRVGSSTWRPALEVLAAVSVER